MKVTVLVDNNAHDDLECEWGFSALIETIKNTVLLDAGKTDVIVRNAKKLGIDLNKVDLCVLSHAHLDHADGFDTFFALNDHAPLLVQPSTAENCYTDEAAEGTFRPMEYIGIKRGMLAHYADRIKRTSGPEEIASEVWIVPHDKESATALGATGKMYVERDGALVPDDFSHEQSLVMQTPKGLVVFNSCSHGGVERIISEVRAAFPQQQIYAYVGGLHLYLRTDEQVRELAQTFRDLGIEHIYTGHCTGERAMEVLTEELGEIIQPFYSGFTFEV